MISKKSNKTYLYIIILSSVVLMSACTISLKFNGASIDYSKIKTISIATFPNNAEYVVPTLSQTFTEALLDKYTRQTRLQVVKQNGDMQIEGEITGYRISSASIAADNYASKTRVTLTINVRYVNTKIPDESFDDKQYTAFQEFDSAENLSSVEDELIKTMVEEIVDQIFNDTASKW